MKKVIKFMRDEFTKEQNKSIAALCGTDLDVIDMREEASRNLERDDDVVNIMATFKVAIGPWQERNRLVIFGMVPSPLMAAIIASDLECEVWHAWNISRSIEGERPVFEFKKWVCVHRQIMSAENFLIEFFGADYISVENETRLEVTFKGYREGFKQSESCILDSGTMNHEEIARLLLITHDEGTDMSWVSQLGENG